ncbi:hypothetical protein L1987_24582 [Smallanthus sonchifolius]|uniref:Uncharacterized protein n=1 Tax=Smallanthus sonchifolius TaxID=185202 RepID=A0ACB9ILF4_9ASTR|nr:hypothetical protein L1987_24582 [Smallanthus sonchifolius]
MVMDIGYLTVGLVHLLKSQDNKRRAFEHCRTGISFLDACCIANFVFCTLRSVYRGRAGDANFYKFFIKSCYILLEIGSYMQVGLIFFIVCVPYKLVLRSNL